MKEKIKKILESLGFIDKAKKNELTNEDWVKIAEAYKKAHGKDFYEDMRAAENDAKTAKENEEKATSHDAALALLNENEVQGKTVEEKVESVIDENKKLKSETEPDKPKDEVKADIKPGTLGLGHTASHVFGIDHDLFARSKRYNEIAATGRIPEMGATNADADVFEQDFALFAMRVSNRYTELKRSGQLALIKADTLGMDYSQLTNAGLGDQFVIRRIDAVISRILEVPDVTHIFPRRSGIQDRELITNAIFGEFSAAYQSGEVFKGNFKLQPEMGKVEDSMMKTKVGSFKWIERTYLGYLNTNGSDPFKPSMIEWIFLNIGTRLRYEQNERNILGYYIQPVAGTPGSYLNAGPGVVHTLLQYAETNKLLPFTQSELADYTAINMVEVVEAFLERVNDVVPSLRLFHLLLNEKHRPWFTASYRRKYGKDIDFTGNTISVPDFSCPIQFVPNLGTLKLMILQQPGNIQLLENIPGEMYAIYFERRLEELLAMSVWKEGVSASHVGIAFANKAELVANNFKLQQIFINYPAIMLEPGATGFDLSKSLIFISGVNAAATSLDGDSLTNPTAGLVFKVECGDATTSKATKIVNGGKFNLKSNWTPAAVGDWIKLVYNAETEKFDEVTRSA
ncbi:MAG: hypothetical protein LBS36_06955 [Oscillospiraceae bacterium]|jgi:hypothetical protein|nr:hypothetical protein [Oscillospiraceae bacterium]